jgi:DNA-directed RNA polymerases I and III subunit RPAC1
MIAEIPTFAIEQVFMHDNTSVIQDEVLAQRVGLIPFKGQRSGLERMEWYKKPTEEDPSKSETTDMNTLRLELEVACTWQEGGMERATKGETDPNKLYINHNVYAKDFRWDPVGEEQASWFKDEPIQPVYPDILIAKLRPGQRIKMTCFMIKGTGADHAKFSPVATASYRLMPTIDIISPIIGADAKKFARCFPKGVIALQPITPEDVAQYPELRGKEKEIKAVVANPMKDTVSRECLRHEEFKDKVKLGRYRDHFIFRVESTGQQDSDELFLESVKLLKLKCQRVKLALDGMMK